MTLTSPTTAAGVNQVVYRALPGETNRLIVTDIAVPNPEADIAVRITLRGTPRAILRSHGRLGCSASALSISCFYLENPVEARIFVGDRADTVTFSAPGWVFGEAGNDVLTSGKQSNHLNGGLGNDRLSGGPGLDHLDGGPGADRIYGGTGHDVLSGGLGNDFIATQFDHQPDSVSCRPGRDVVRVDRLDRVIGCEVVQRVS